MKRHSQRLAEAAPELEQILTRGALVAPIAPSPPLFSVSEIRCETVWVRMRDGIRLATDLYLPPILPAPAICMRTPYRRANDRYIGCLFAFARRGYVVIAQDCRGTGDSEPDSWDYYMYESEDGVDFVEWVSQQSWFDGFLGSCGGSYVGQTQWPMATHTRMSTIVPEVSGLGVAINTAHLYMTFNAYARTVGKGTGKVNIHSNDMERLLGEETLAGGYFNEPLHQPFSERVLAKFPQLRGWQPSQAKRWLWEQYCAMTSPQRAAFVKQIFGTENVSVLEVEALSAIFGHQISHDAHTFPHVSSADLCRLVHAPVLLHTGWYDWCLNDALATWELIRREAQESVRERSRLIITPSAHGMPGYHEAIAGHPELQHNHRTENNIGLLLRWYAAVREGTTDTWPTVIYYLMGANEWRSAPAWPPSESRLVPLYLGAGGTLIVQQAPQKPSQPDRYTYDPEDPTPTVGGSIVSSVYPVGSVDVSDVQKRSDVLTYTTSPLEHDIDVVGPLKMNLYASSSAVDTDFVVRLSDVFPDGRAIQIQSGILRARYRNANGEAELLEPGRIYLFEIDLWATANRFKAGNRIRLDISSADFPKFDRNSNRGGEPGLSATATQTIYHDPEKPSHLLVSVLDVI